MDDAHIQVDTHFHIWDLKKFQYQFPTPDLDKIYRNVTAEEYGEQLSDTPVKYGIFVQVESTVAEQEAEWVMDLAKDNSFIKGVVAGFNLDDPNFGKLLDKYATSKLFLGVRNILELHEEKDWLLSAGAVGGISQLADRGIPYHILINDHALCEYVPELLKQFPNHPFVLDHMGKPAIMEKETEGWDSWIAQVASFPNVYCKISSQLFPHSGPLTAAEKRGEFTADQHKYVHRCLEVFGAERCMFGSDWPVCTLHGMTSVKEFHDSANRLLDDRVTQAERDMIFGGNAIKFYNLTFK